MPIEIIRQDITKIQCDAIVNPTNKELIADGGLDYLIHKVAGEGLDKECENIKPIEVGKSKITKGYNLPCKYVIHTVGPIWKDGKNNEKELLENCYKSAFKLASLFKCNSVAFPLISSGTYGYPKDQVLKVAVNTLSALLDDNEMQVYLVVYDKDSFEISEKIFSDVKEYISDNYIFVQLTSNSRRSFESKLCQPRERRIEEDLFCSYSICEDKALTLDDFIENMDKGFAETLFYYIDKKGLTDVECYKKANVDKKTFSKIKCQKDYRPSKKTAVSFAIALKLNLKETEHLLKTVGMTLSKSNLFDVIILYFITTGNYDNIYDVNEVLYKFDQITLS